MQITLDAATEKLVLQEIELGHADAPEEVIARALASYVVVRSDPDHEWTEEEKAWLEAHLAESEAEIERGEVFTPEEARAELKRLRAARS
jgi:predicted transcriptional regulator